MTKTLDDFYNDLGARESGGNYTIINKWGYVGKYQMGEAAMVDAGYYRKPSRKYNNDWTGQFTGKDGIYSLQDFLNNKQAQENAQKAFKIAQWKQLKAIGVDKYIGKEINGIKITQSGLLAAAHLKGAGNVQIYLQSNGTYIPKDGNGTSVEEYLKKFGGYDVSQITGLKSDISGEEKDIQSKLKSNIAQENIPGKKFELRIEKNRYLPEYFPHYNEDPIHLNYNEGISPEKDIPVEKHVNNSNIGLPSLHDIPPISPFKNSNYKKNEQITDYPANHIFTPEEIGRMSREEYDKYDTVIMKQLEAGLIRNSAPQINYKDFRNPESGSKLIYTREDISKMSTSEYLLNEKEILAQTRIIGVPFKRDLPDDIPTYEKQKSQYNNGHWVTIEGNHVFIED